MYELIFSPKALKELKKLEKNLQLRILAVLERVRIRPDAHLQKLVGMERYKVRIGDYRAVVELDNSNKRIAVVKVGHRRNIYDFPF